MPGYLRRWLKPPRRLRVKRIGGVFIGGTLLIGLAAIPTGNNLLFLLLGAMLGFIAVSGWLSEQMVRNVAILRRVPHGATAGQPTRITYELANPKRRLPCFALDVGEAGSPARAFVANIQPRSTVITRAEGTWPHRGVYQLDTVTLATSFPFGLFRKERDVELAGEMIVWPRADRRVPDPRPAGARPRQGTLTPFGAAGTRGEYRGLRDYRSGDDPRDVHWRSTARRGNPVVREYERDAAEALWICLELRGPGDEQAETSVEVAASLAAAALRRGQPFGLATPDVRVAPGAGPVQLERVLDALARARFRPDAPRLIPPVPAPECVWARAEMASAA